MVSLVNAAGGGFELGYVVDGAILTFWGMKEGGDGSACYDSLEGKTGRRGGFAQKGTYKTDTKRNIKTDKIMRIRFVVHIDT